MEWHKACHSVCIHRNMCRRYCMMERKRLWKTGIIGKKTIHTQKKKPPPSYSWPKAGRPFTANDEKATNIANCPARNMELHRTCGSDKSLQSHEANNATRLQP